MTWIYPNHLIAVLWFLINCVTQNFGHRLDILCISVFTTSFPKRSYVLSERVVECSDVKSLSNFDRWGFKVRTSLGADRWSTTFTLFEISSVRLRSRIWFRVLHHNKVRGNNTSRWFFLHSFIYIHRNFTSNHWRSFWIIGCITHMLSIDSI
jgi:hypothetical protein